MTARYNNNVEVVESLVKSGADVNVVAKVSYCIYNDFNGY